jgi:hypothetical protein
MKIGRVNLLEKWSGQKSARPTSVLAGIVKVIFLTLVTTKGFGQDGNAGITAATTNITSYFATGVTLMYAIGAVLGLVGAVKVYQKWSHGDQDTSKVAASWFGSCIFLVIVATVLKSFFGV